MVDQWLILPQLCTWPGLEVIQMGVGMEHMHKKADPFLHWRSWEMQKWVRIVKEYWKVLPFPFPHVYCIMGDTKGQKKIKIINDKLPWRCVSSTKCLHKALNRNIQKLSNTSQWAHNKSKYFIVSICQSRMQDGWKTTPEEDLIWSSFQD